MHMLYMSMCMPVYVSKYSFRFVFVSDCLYMCVNVYVSVYNMCTTVARLFVSMYMCMYVSM